MALIIAKKIAPQTITLRKFHKIRNDILVIRETGGLGDILMHRQIFEDFKSIMPEARIVFAVPAAYLDAARNHPFVDEVVDCRQVNTNDYVISYNTTTACGRYEMSIAPYSNKNRSDIWANHCGIVLKNHNMHINIDADMVEFGNKLIKQLKKDHNGPVVAFCPISAMSAKNLTKDQMQEAVKELRNKGCFVIAVHNKPIPELTEIDVTVLCGFKIREWMGILNTADYVVSVDSAAFHFAGGIGKPLLGIFTFTDSKVYSKYYKSEIVQIHRDTTKGWCGPCYTWSSCPKTDKVPKPCLTEISHDMIRNGIKRLFSTWPNKNIKTEIALNVLL